MKSSAEEEGSAEVGEQEEVTSSGEAHGGRVDSPGIALLRLSERILGADDLRVRSTRRGEGGGGR